MDNLGRLLLTFYWNPRRASSDILDHGRLFPAIVIALCVAAALQAPHFVLRQKIETAMRGVAGFQLPEEGVPVEEQAAHRKKPSPQESTRPEAWIAAQAPVMSVLRSWAIVS